MCEKLQTDVFSNKEVVMKLKIGVLGAGHLGKIHLKLIKEIVDYELVGFYDADTERSQQIAKELDIQAFEFCKS